MPDMLARELGAGLLNLAAIALAAEMVGGAQRCLDMSVSYAKTRHQFDRPIGSFQVIKHKCADMLMDIETAVPLPTTPAGPPPRTSAGSSSSTRGVLE